MELYPLKFIPQIHEKIWGGNRLYTELGKPGNNDFQAGESWEISGVQDHVSVVSNGSLEGNSLEELCEIFMGELLGDMVYEKFGIEFPLLIKFIDANDDLSIQVHPTDELAAERHQAYGKTEMWFILEADPGSRLLFGFQDTCNANLFKQAVDQGKVLDLMKEIPVTTGDSFFIPAGKVHAIGRGILLAEIQQTSDVTYRIYDFDRINEKGEKRELHLDLAMDAIDFDSTDSGKIAYQVIPNQPINLSTQQYFETNFFSLKQIIQKDYHDLDSFVIYICLSGEMVIHYTDTQSIGLKKGETILIPAVLDQISIEPDGTCEFLEVFIPNYH